MSNYKRLTGKKEIVLKPDSDYITNDPTLEGGIYKIWMAGNMMTGYYPAFCPVDGGDKLVRFTSGIVHSVIGTVDKFFSEESKKSYEELKVTHKMGLLFYGRAGTGKTSVCMLIMHVLVERYSAICLDCTNNDLRFIKSTISDIRRYQKGPIVVFVDEFDSHIQREEESYLTFLDGTDSIDNLIFIGCTNYLDNIPDRIKKRKGRLKKVYNIDALPMEVYKEYLTDRVPSMNIGEISKFAYLASENKLTIDQLKHALIDHKIERVPIEEAINESLKFEA